MRRVLERLRRGAVRRSTFVLRVGAVVLCGGKSSRMGRPKAWLPVGGETMLGHIVRLLGWVVSPIVVVAAPGQDVPPLPEGVEVVRDPAQDCGPLQGLAAGLAALTGRAEAAYVSACDAPLLRPAFVRRLIDLLGVDSIAVPSVDGRCHPLAAVYRVEVVEIAQWLLGEGKLRLGALIELAPARVVQANELTNVDPALDSLRNLNTPEEYEAALAVLDPSGHRLDRPAP